jgi:hypothetical protein
MNRLWTLAKIIGIALTIAYVVVSWIEADREIRILCGMFEPGQPRSHVVTTLETGEYLRYRTRPSGRAQEVQVSSYYNGLNSVCTVTLENDHVTATAHRTGAQADVLFGE